MIIRYCVLLSSIIFIQDVLAEDVGIPFSSEGGTHTYVSSNLYVQENFQFNTSSRVGMVSTENTSVVAVGTVHGDGRYRFAGSSEGGTVDTCGQIFAVTGPKSAPLLDLAIAGGCGES